MKESATKKTPEKHVYRFKTGQGDLFLPPFDVYQFFKVNRINYNYYDHHSLSMPRPYHRVM